jgi:phosphoglycerate dehydrogenase-like enzyme
MPDPNLPLVVITDFLDESSVESPVLENLAHIRLARAWNEAELAPQIAQARVLIVYHDLPHVGITSFNAAPHCRAVVRAGVGYNNIDRAAAAERGIIVCNVPDYGTEDVADHALALMLAVARQMIPCHEAIRLGRWNYHDAIAAPRLRGKQLGIVGCGRIGTAMALRARALGMNITFFDPYAVPGYEKAIGARRFESLPELLQTSDVVSLHCWLDDHTHHLIDNHALGLMKPGAILVNTARGPIVDQKALLAALDSGKLLGAGIDVVEVEPLDDDALRAHPRVVLTPHSAFYTREGFIELRRKTAEEARRILTGHPPRCPVPPPASLGA